LLDTPPHQEQRGEGKNDWPEALHGPDIGKRREQSKGKGADAGFRPGGRS
jgi:hypothetical protein